MSESALSCLTCGSQASVKNGQVASLQFKIINYQFKIIPGVNYPLMREVDLVRGKFTRTAKN